MNNAENLKLVKVQNILAILTNDTAQLKGFGFRAVLDSKYKERTDCTAAKSALLPVFAAFTPKGW